LQQPWHQETHQGLIGTKRNKLGCQGPPTMLHMCTCEH
jgi:hypothetical protein